MLTHIQERIESLIWITVEQRKKKQLVNYGHAV